jgi:hypothetical protein
MKITYEGFAMQGRIVLEISEIRGTGKLIGF